MEGDLNPADLEMVRRYIAINRQAIIDYWNEKTDGVELARSLRSPKLRVANQPTFGGRQ